MIVTQPFGSFLYLDMMISKPMEEVVTRIKLLHSKNRPLHTRCPNTPSMHYKFEIRTIEWATIQT